MATIKEGELVVSRQYGPPWSRKPRPHWGILSSEGNGTLRLRLYASRSEAKSDVPAVDDFQVLADVVGKAAKGFTLAKLNMFGRQITQFEHETEGEAWYAAVSVVKLGTQEAKAAEKKAPRKLSIPAMGALPGPMARMLHKVVEAPVNNLVGAGMGGGAVERAQPEHLRRHTVFLDLVARFDRIGLEAILLPEATLTKPIGEVVAGRNSVVETLYQYQRMMTVKQVGEVSGKDDVTECVKLYYHFTFQLNFAVRERIEWKGGQVNAIVMTLENEELAGKLKTLLQIHKEYAGKVHELVDEALPYDFLTDPTEEAAMMQKFEMDKVLGAGAFGTVKLAHNKEDGTVRAIKSIPKELQDKESLELEIKLMRKAMEAMAELPYVVRLFETYEGPGDYFLVMEVVAGGEVFDRIAKQGVFSEADAHHLMRQLMTGMSRLHEAGIMHRDLKPENLLYASNDADSTIKIADFGLGCFFNDIFHVHAACGTPLYMAPELVVSGEMCFLDDNGMAMRVFRTYGPSVDVWSCGCIMYQLLSGECPFLPEWRMGADGEYGWDLDSMYAKICSAEYYFPEEAWKGVSSSAKNCIKMMLQLNPSTRPTASAVLESEWLQNKSPPSVPLPRVSTYINKHQQSYRSDKFDKNVVAASRQRIKDSLMLQHAKGDSSSTPRLESVPSTH